MNRSGKIGLFAMVILMFSIVLFIGSLFWLYITGPWTGSENKFFQPGTYEPSLNPSGYNSSNEEFTLEDAIYDLRDIGVSCLSYNKSMDISKAEIYDYSEFRNSAINNDFVLIVEDDEGHYLLTFNDSKQVVWIPE